MVVRGRGGSVGWICSGGRKGYDSLVWGCAWQRMCDVGVGGVVVVVRARLLELLDDIFGDSLQPIWCPVTVGGRLVLPHMDFLARSHGRASGSGVWGGCRGVRGGLASGHALQV